MPSHWESRKDFETVMNEQTILKYTNEGWELTQHQLKKKMEESE